MKKASIIRAKFLRSNIQTTTTMLWVELKDKELIRSNIRLLENEEVILCYVPNTKYWWLLTEQRLIIFEDLKVKYIQFVKINSIEPKEVFDAEKSKYDSTKLVLDTPDGDMVLIVEEGTWHVIYSILKFVVDK
jgi:hypothetical protein